MGNLWIKGGDMGQQYYAFYWRVLSVQRFYYQWEEVGGLESMPPLDTKRLYILFFQWEEMSTKSFRYTQIPLSSNQPSFASLPINFYWGKLGVGRISENQFLSKT